MGSAYPRIPLTALLALPLLLAAAARADDWPQWRGPNRDGVWSETGILESFPPGGLKTRWRAKVGPGWSSPVVAKGRVYLTDSELQKPKARERVHCFDAATGRPLWTHSYEVAYPDWAFADRGPTATPIVQDGKLYTLGNKGDLYCLDARKGDVLWKRNLEKDYGVQEFAFNASPLIEGDLLVVCVGSYPGTQPSSVLALDKKSGKEVWKVPTGGLTNSSPIVVTAGGKRQLIVWAQDGVLSLDPAMGKTYWQQKMTTAAASAVTTPVFDKNRLLLSGLMLKLDPDKPAASVLWPDSKAVSARTLSVTSTGLIQGDYVFSVKSSGQLVCLQAGTGKQVWQTDKVTTSGSGASIHLTPNGDGVFLYTDRGELIRAQLTAKGYKEVSRALLLEPTTPNGSRKMAWPPPAYASRCVFARNDKELVCVSLAEQSPEFTITTKRKDDSVEVQTDKGKVAFVVKSPFGISQATIERKDEKWPKEVVVRFHLKGLERFDVGNGKVTLHAAAGVRDGKPDVRLWKDDKEGEGLKRTDPLWTDIRILGSDGKPAKEFPPKGGYFEVTLPRALFEGSPKSIRMNWIDFYR